MSEYQATVTARHRDNSPLYPDEFALETNSLVLGQKLVWIPLLDSNMFWC
ncbi:hypothetical protein JHK85_028444 [Glycine max]|nr:hypothetical protein JHK85_028444 [Glycine max]